MTKLKLNQSPPAEFSFRFFLTAPLFGILTGIWIAYRGSSLFLNPFSLETIALTHLMTLGWLLTIIMGALYQLISVLIGTPIPWMALGRWVHGLWSVGVIVFCGGLLQYSSFMISLALITMGGALSIFFTQTLLTLLQSRENTPTAWALRISIPSLAIAAGIGILMTGNLGSLWVISIDRNILRNIHLVFALIGGMGGTIVGVGFHLIPMFYLSHSFPFRWAKFILIGEIISLITAPLALWLQLPTTWIILTLVPALCAGLGFVVAVQVLFQRRRTKLKDTTFYYLMMALLALSGTIILIGNFIWIDYRTLNFLVGVLFIFGVAVALTMGMLFKIVPFLVWLHRYAPLIGKTKIPTLKSLSPDSNIRRLWVLTLVGFVLLIIAAMTQIDGIVRLSGLSWAFVSLCFGVELLKLTRLQPSSLPSDWPVKSQIEQTIVGFHQDPQGDWVMELECGHARHVRHNPPWMDREWVLTEEGRQNHIGLKLSCKQCQEGEIQSLPF